MNAFSSPNSTWAKDAIREIDQGHARGNRKALVVRSKLQTVFRKFGRFTQSHCAPVILVGFIPLIICAFGLTRATLETNAENLWIEVGGRLEEELKYTKKSLGEGYGGTNELLIQTPNEEGINILSVKAMRQHLDAVTRATNVTVELFDQTWTLKDICYTLSLPPMNNHWDDLLPQLLPCVIITPLDCFWEGAKPLGPKELVNLGLLGSLKWTTINPEELVKLMQSSYADDQLPFNLAELSGLLKEAGITSGYVKKPCLDPDDPECPKTAPNYKTKKKPDIGVELTGGCQGFATKFLDWPEELIVGGVVKNKTGIIRSAAAYQSIIMLMGKQQLFEHWQGQAKVGHFEWSEEAASQVLESWKREFTKTINNVDQSKEDSTVLAFSSTSFNDLLKDFSQTSKTKVAIGYVLMLIYAFLTLKRWSDGVDSHGALGFGGVLLVTVAVASGLGFCSFIGIKFNAASTQILPFLALGLGVDDMFLLAHTYSTSKDKTNEPVEYCLASTGVSVFLTSFNNMFAFFMAALIPIPALRSFSLQAAIVVVFNFFAVIVIFPAMIAADIKRRKSGRYDLFCFCQRTDPQRISITPSTSVDSSLVLHRYHNSSNSLSDSSAIVQGVSSTVILPGSIQATASQTIHLPNVVTVQASALAEVGGQPVSQRQHRRWHGRKGKQVSESEDIELSATSNVCSGNGVGIGRGKAGASANVVQVQVAGSIAAEQKSSKESASRLPFQGHNRAFKVHPEKSVIDRCSCMDPATSSEQRSKRHPVRSTSKDSVVNENARYFAKNYSKDSVVNDNSVLFRSREETKAWASAPRNVQFQVSANAVSNGETSVAKAECSSVQEPSRTSSSHSRSSSGVESMERASTSVSWCDTQGAFSSWWQKLEFLSLTAFARDYYGPWLQKMPVKIFVLFVFACLFAAGVYGSMRVEKGLDLTDVVPRESPEHRFVEAQFKFFSFYHMAAVTKEDFDYASGQELLYQFHAAFRKIPNIIKTPAGDLPHFWLIYFREWLEGLQEAFDRDWNEGRINYSGWQANASDDGVIAFKLLAQTGEKESVNHSIVRSVRLVSEDGIIRPETFYKYLMVWCSMDYLGYTFSQANIRPVPTTGGHWSNIRSVQTYRAMRVEPPAPPINFSFIPFNLINIRNTNDFIDIIKSVRAISDEFSDKGLPNYPSGVPFTFWEQYIWLGHRLMVAVSIVLATSFVVMAVILCNFWAAMFIVIVLAMITVEVYGFMGLAGIKLSAVPAVTLILSVGVGVEFTVHMCMQFLTSRGDRNQRMQRAVEHVFSPVVDGAVSTLLGVIMLAGSDFDFIVRYFFHLLAALIVIGTINGLVFLPVLLSLAGPGPEVEELAPPRTASSAGSNREFLPGSSCRQRTPPTDSEICIVESIARQEEKSSGSGGRRPRRKKGHHGSNSRGNKRSNPNRCTPPVDSDSSSSTVTRVTTRATVTVEVHTEHTSERSSHPNFRAGAQAGRPFHSEEEIDEEEMHITSLEDYGDDLKR